MGMLRAVANTCFGGKGLPSIRMKYLSVGFGATRNRLSRTCFLLSRYFFPSRRNVISFIGLPKLPREHWYYCTSPVECQEIDRPRPHGGIVGHGRRGDTSPPPSPP